MQCHLQCQSIPFMRLAIFIGDNVSFLLNHHKYSLKCTYHFSAARNALKQSISGYFGKRRKIVDVVKYDDDGDDSDDDDVDDIE